MKKTIRILHIDDNVHDRQLVKDALDEEQDIFEIVEADSREKFERLIIENTFDLILSDFNILGFDGLQVLERVKEVNPDLPVIIVTGTGSEEIAIQAMKMGAKDYVIKSVSHIRGLSPTIKTVLEHKEIEAERKRGIEEIYKLNQTLELRVRERTAELESINKGLESFCFSISHDLRSPLAAISLSAQILAKKHGETSNKETQEYADYIVEASKRMQKLVKDLLDYSRLGKKYIDIHPISLNEILEKIHNDFRVRLEEIGGKFTIKKDLPKIQGDESLLIQIFTNLIDNAITYRRKDVPLEIEVSMEEKHKDYLLKVRDNGIGISKENWEKIFNIFEHLNNDEEYSGSGIGLATVQKAVSLLDGDIRVESELGKGSSFIIKFHKK